jgi:nucleoid-associated protein YgaU
MTLLTKVRNFMAKRKKKSTSSIKYKVFGGDTLHSIAARYLGSGDRWMEIYEINKKDIGLDPHHLTPGQELTMPQDYKPQGQS